MSWSIVVSSLVCDLVSNLAIKIVRAFATAIFNSGTEIVSIPPAAAALDNGTNSSRPPSMNFSIPTYRMYKVYKINAIIARIFILSPSLLNESADPCKNSTTGFEFAKIDSIFWFCPYRSFFCLCNSSTC